VGDVGTAPAPGRRGDCGGDGLLRAPL